MDDIVKEPNVAYKKSIIPLKNFGAKNASQQEYEYFRGEIFSLAGK